VSSMERGAGGRDSPITEGPGRSKFASMGPAARVTVGTEGTHSPPHRSVPALLRHTAPTLGEWRRSVHMKEDEECGMRYPALGVR